MARRTKPLHRGNNYVTCTTNPETGKAVVQMHIDGEPGQWIEFDVEQLKGLIRLFDNQRIILEALAMSRRTEPPQPN